MSGSQILIHRDPESYEIVLISTEDRDIYVAEGGYLDPEKPLIVEYFSGNELEVLEATIKTLPGGQLIMLGLTKLFSSNPQSRRWPPRKNLSRKSKNL